MGQNDNINSDGPASIIEYAQHQAEIAAEKRWPDETEVRYSLASIAANLAEVLMQGYVAGGRLVMGARKRLKEELRAQLGLIANMALLSREGAAGAMRGLDEAYGMHIEKIREGGRVDVEAYQKAIRLAHQELSRLSRREITCERITGLVTRILRTGVREEGYHPPRGRNHGGVRHITGTVPLSAHRIAPASAYVWA